MPSSSQWSEQRGASIEEGAAECADAPLSVAMRNGALADESQVHLAQLSRTIEMEIIPRLVLARGGAPKRALANFGNDESISAPERAEFTKLLLVRDAGAAPQFAAALIARGVGLEELLMGLLAPAARELGKLWEEDRCDFTEVTVGVWRLHQILRELSPATPNEAPAERTDRRIVLVPIPGEQHVFGVYVVAEFLRRASWEVLVQPPASNAEMLGLVRREAFDVIGLSVGSHVKLEGLAATIVALRKASRNTSVGVMVGGPVFVGHPELAALVGADATAADAPSAVQQAEGLVAMLARRC